MNFVANIIETRYRLAQTTIKQILITIEITLQKNPSNKSYTDVCSVSWLP